MVKIKLQTIDLLEGDIEKLFNFFIQKNDLSVNKIKEIEFYENEITNFFDVKLTKVTFKKLFQKINLRAEINKDISTQEKFNNIYELFQKNDMNIKFNSKKEEELNKLEELITLSSYPAQKNLTNLMDDMQVCTEKFEKYMQYIKQEETEEYSAKYDYYWGDEYKYLKSDTNINLDNILEDIEFLLIFGILILYGIKLQDVQYKQIAGRIKEKNLTTKCNSLLKAFASIYEDILSIDVMLGVDTNVTLESAELLLMQLIVIYKSFKVLPNSKESKIYNDVIKKFAKIYDLINNDKLNEAEETFNSLDSEYKIKLLKFYKKLKDKTYLKQIEDTQMVFEKNTNFKRVENRKRDYLYQYIIDVIKFKIYSILFKYLKKYRKPDTMMNIASSIVKILTNTSLKGISFIDNKNQINEPIEFIDDEKDIINLNKYREPKLENISENLQLKLCAKYTKSGLENFKSSIILKLPESAFDKNSQFYHQYKSIMHLFDMHLFDRFNNLIHIDKY